MKMKKENLYCIRHYLICDSGFKIYLIKAKDEEQAKKKYLKINKIGYNLGVTAEKITNYPYKVIDFDNPNYEG